MAGDTFARPWAVVVESFNTVVAVVTVLRWNVLTSYKFASIAIKMGPIK